MNRTLDIQFRVIFALILREIHTLYGHRKLGYLWALIRSACSIFIFWTIRTVMHFKPPHGQHVLVFLAMGFMIWHIFSKTVSKILDADKGNRKLLTYPQVCSLDIILARTLVIVATEIVCIGIIFQFAAFFNVDIYICNFLYLYLALVFVIFLAIGFGSCCSALAVFFPVIETILPMFLRILFFASGVFFSVSSISSRVGSWLLYNPILQIIEMARTAMSKNYVSPYFSTDYLFFVILTLLTIGLLLQRFQSKRVLA